MMPFSIDVGTSTVWSALLNYVNNNYRFKLEVQWVVHYNC